MNKALVVVLLSIASLCAVGLWVGTRDSGTQPAIQPSSGGAEVHGDPVGAALTLDEGAPDSVDRRPEVGAARSSEQAEDPVEHLLAGTFILGRAVDGAGAALAEVRLRIEWSPGDGEEFGSFSGSVATDSKGDFRWEFDTSMLLTESRDLTLSLRLLQQNQGELAGPRRYLVSSSRHLPGPIAFPVRLGDVVLAEPALHAGGRVVDSFGRGIEGARVEAYFEEALDTGTDDSEVEWEYVPKQLGGRAGALGEFELRGPSEGLLAIRATADGFLPGGMRPFYAGELGIEYVLEQGGSILFSFASASKPVPFAVLAQIRPRDQAALASFEPGDWEEREGDWWGRGIGTAGEYLWESLPPGAYDLRFQAGEPAHVIGPWEEVVVFPGETTRDPRLLEIDLEARLPLLGLEVADAEGLPLPRARVHFVIEGERSPWGQSIHGGAGLVIVEGSASAFYVVASGYLEQELAIDGASMRVVLDRAPEVKLTLPESVDLGGLQSLRASVMVRDETGGGWLDMPGVREFSIEGREAVFSPSSLGTVRVVLSCRVPVGGTMIPTFVRFTDGPFLIDIDATPEGQHFELPLTAEAIEAARAAAVELRAKRD